MANTSLNKYNKKRDFSSTKEPKGKKGKNSSLFVIQKHDATSLHYDFRLSIEGVLVLWAVPKGLSTKAGEKRLAIRTEDHPMDYANFEGVIPEGEYGGGTVLVWDTGEYEPIAEDESHEKTMKQALDNGAMKLYLHGEKLKGGYALVNTGTNNGNEQWLIFKLDDDEADGRRNPVSTQPDSVLTGRSLKDIEDDDNHE